MAGDIIDSLSIELNSNATKANKSIDELIGKLGNLANSLSRIDGSGLNGLANGIGNLANSMQTMKGVGNAKFENLANGINKLTAIDTSGLNKSASSLYQITKSFGEVGKAGESTKSIADLATNLSKLGNKGVSNAVTNIPKLATAMKDLMTTLSTAPKVSNNLIQMTTALAGLASNGQKISGATKGITSSLKTYGSSATNATSKTKSLASMFGSLYANFFWVRRGINGIKDAVKSSMDYIETLNYFDAAFGQVADTAVKDWKSAGYKSAEEYYNSFSERAKKLTSQMSGFDISPTGTLESTGKASLGIDPNRLMNYQATFAQMSSSIGITAENSLKLQRALTEIGADLASVKNMDFNKTWNDMASGLAGMSRTLDKYGVNIRNVNLQQKLSDLGIKANIQNLNQNEKALLRTIILLDSTKYAWGDLAETLNQPANQVRLLQANFQNLTRTIGNLFMPVVAKVLPYINALTIALQQLFSWIGKSLGIDMSKITSSVGDSAFDMNELEDATDGVGDALDDVSDKAKKAKDNINTIGIDKLNIISKNKDTTSTTKTNVGLGDTDLSKLNKAFDDAYKKYQKAWNKAFKDADNKAQKIADKIVKAFKRGDYEGIGKYIGSSITKGLNKIPWETVYQGGKDFGKNFADFLNGLISPDLFGTVGKTIAGALNTAIYTALSFGEEFNFKNLGESIASGINNFFETFDFTSLAKTMNTWANGIYETLWNIIKNIHWGSVLKGAFDFISELEPQTVLLLVLGKKFKTFTKDAGVIGGLGKVFKTAGSSIAGALNKIIPSLQDVGAKQTFSKGITKISTSFKELRSNLTATQKGVIGVVSVWAEFKVLTSTFEGLTKGTENLVIGIGKIVGVSALAGAALYTAFGPAGLAIGAIVGIAGAIKGIIDANKDLEREKMLSSFVDETAPKIDELKGKFEELNKETTTPYEKLNTELGKIDESNKKIDTTVSSINNIGIAISSGTATVAEKKDELVKLFGDLQSELKEKSNQTFATISSELYAHADELKEQGIIVDDVVGDLAESHNKYNDTLNTLFEKLNKTKEGTKEYEKIWKKIQKTAGVSTETVSTVKETTNEFNEILGKGINLKDFIKEGKFDTDAFKEKLQDFSESYTEAKDEIESAYKELYKQIEEAPDISEPTKNQLIGYFSEFEKNDVDALKTNLKTTLFDPLKIEIGKNAEQLFKDTPDKTQLGIQNALKSWDENVYNPLYSVISGTFGDLGVNTSGFGKNLAQTLLESMFLDENGNTIIQLGDNWKKRLYELITGVDLADAGEKLRKKIKKQMKNALDLTISLDVKTSIKNVADKTDITKKLLSGSGYEIVNKANIEANNIKIDKYATGGFPEDGLFFANHEELVGKFSNGKNVVANNAQITDGIEEAAYRGYMRAMASQPTNTNSGIPKVETKIYLDKREIARAVNEENNRSGASILGYGTGY
ncbi:MAG: hypothetical protein ACLRZ9_05885 [Eubacterium sp.]